MVLAEQRLHTVDNKKKRYCSCFRCAAKLVVHDIIIQHLLALRVCTTALELIFVMTAI